MTGTMVRYRRLFRADDRSVVVALDHAQFQGAIPGLESMKDIVARVVDGGADGIILNPGPARDCAEIYAGRSALIVRITGACTSYNPSFDYHRQICSVEQAIAMGADAVIAMGFVGNDGEPASLKLLGGIAKSCRRFGMPLIAEMLPAAPDKFQDAEAIGLASRIGYELGADIIKAYTTGTEADERIIRNCSLPFLAAGGPKSSNPAEIVASAIAHGAAGVAFGRNVFAAEDPQQVVRELVREVHGE